VVPSALEGKSFFSKDVRASSAIVAPTASFDVQRWEGRPVSEKLEKLFEIRSVLSATIAGENFKGRLFFLDKSNLSSDDLTLAEVVAGHAATSLELFYFLQRLQQLVTLGERHRLSRDLHDGVLQSLTAGGLRLRAALDLLQSDRATATQQLRGLQELIVQEQRELRSFIESLRLPLLVPIEEDFKLAQSLEQLSRTIERQWSLRVELMNGSMGENLPTPLAREIYYIVREGLVNAARHSRGSMARVELKANDHQVYINLSDDGRGFSFRGDFDHATLLSKGLGPATLKSRIASLNGLLNISSSASGARLQIILPFSPQRA
jgi:signal transduction histidine kinase